MCEDYVRRKFTMLTGNIAETFDSINSFITEKFAAAETAKEVQPFNSEREGEYIKLFPAQGGDVIRVNSLTAKPVSPGSDYPPEVQLHLAIFNKRKDVNNAIVHSKAGDSCRVKMLQALKALA